MSKLLNVGTMRERIQAALIFEESKKTGVRKEAALALHYLFSTHSKMGRAAYKQMTGLGERVATDYISSLLSGQKSNKINWLELALRNRQVRTEQVDGAVERIEEKLLNLGLREVLSTRIGELVMHELK
jgi:hypothetical protein